MITINFSTESDAAPSWGGFPHERLHQQRVKFYPCSQIRCSPFPTFTGKF
ncbi:hypothetical protein [Moorena producens]|nr:hypothetical protein [Moorena producens]